MKPHWTGLALVVLATSAAAQTSPPDRAREAPRKEPRVREPSSASRPAERREGVALVSGAPEPRATRRPWMVEFTVRGADLAGEVLPLFKAQVGLEITYDGPPRAVTLPLVQPVPWEAALELVCQFTDTHLVRDHRDRLRLEDGWAGRLEVPRLVGRYDPALRGVPPPPPPRIPRLIITRGGTLAWGSVRPRHVGPARPWPGVQAPRSPQVGPRRVGPRVTGGPPKTGVAKTGVAKTGAARPWPTPYGVVRPKRVGPRKTGVGDQRPRRR